jgi:ribose transport system substrate-binding protein
MKKIALLAAALGLAAAGCSHAGQGTSGSGPAASSAPAKISVAFITNSPSNYWADARRGTEEAEKENPNVDVQFIEPGDVSAAVEQKADIDQLLAKGVQGIAISPFDPANQTPMLNEAASKAVLITQDSDAPTSNRICYIGTDNEAAGRMAGDLIKKALPNGGKIMLFVGKRDAQNAMDREKGVREEIAGSKIVIIDVRTDDGDAAVGKTNAADAIIKYPDLAGMVGLWSYNGPSCLGAVRDAHKVGKIKIVCFDADPDTVGGIKDGSVYGTIVQQPYQFGLLAVQDMVKAIGGDKSWIPASKQIMVPTRAITKDNVASLASK